jgi:hypothetical protein
VQKQPYLSVIDGVPALLRDDIEQMVILARASMAQARNCLGSNEIPNFTGSLGVSGLSAHEDERTFSWGRNRHSALIGQ